MGSQRRRLSGCVHACARRHVGATRAQLSRCIGGGGRERGGVRVPRRGTLYQVPSMRRYKLSGYPLRARLYREKPVGRYLKSGFLYAFRIWRAWPARRGAGGRLATIAEGTFFGLDRASYRNGRRSFVLSLCLSLSLAAFPP